MVLPIQIKNGDVYRDATPTELRLLFKIEQLRTALERVLLDIDFMVERGTLADISSATIPQGRWRYQVGGSWPSTATAAAKVVKFKIEYPELFGVAPYLLGDYLLDRVGRVGVFPKLVVEPVYLRLCIIARTFFRCDLKRGELLRV
jgi:hypothetical protein